MDKTLIKASVQLDINFFRSQTLAVFYSSLKYWVSMHALLHWNKLHVEWKMLHSDAQRNQDLVFGLKLLLFH